MNKGKKHNFFHDFTCQHYSELASKNIDTELSIKESILFKLHNVLCLLCRRCKNQIETIEKTCCSMAKNNDLNPSNERLSDKCKEKIKQSLN